MQAIMQLPHSEILIDHPTIKGLRIKINVTTNSIKVESGQRNMSIADYNTKTHTYGGAVYFFNGKPTDRNNELRNTTYFEDMERSLADKALALDRREKRIKEEEAKLREDNGHVCRTITELREREERVLQREADCEKRENVLDMVADGIRRTTTRSGVENREHPEDKLIFKLADGNQITLRRKNLDRIVWVKP